MKRWAFQHFGGGVETAVNPANMENAPMKHIQVISRKPAKAADITVGQVVAVLAAILGVLGEALISKQV